MSIPNLNVEDLSEKEKKKKKSLLSPRKRTHKSKSDADKEPTSSLDKLSSESGNNTSGGGFLEKASPRTPTPTPTTNASSQGQKGLPQKYDFADLEDQTPIVIETQVERHEVSTVTVYSSRAEVVRTCNLDFPTVPSQYRINIKGFPETVDSTSIRMSLPSEYGVILEVAYRERVETETDIKVDDRTELEKKRDELLQTMKLLEADIDRISKGIEWIEEYRNGLTLTTPVDVPRCPTIMPQTDYGLEDGNSVSSSSGLMKKAKNKNIFVKKIPKVRVRTQPQEVEQIEPEEHDVPPLEVFDSDVSFEYLEFFIQEQDGLQQLLRRKQNSLDEKQKELEEVSVEIQKLIPKNETVKILEVLLLVHHLPKPNHIGLQLSYLVSGGTWSSGYQARLTDNENSAPTIDLTYYATIINSSGEHWNDCNVLLSTAVPSSKGEMPQLVQTTLQIYRAPRRLNMLSDAAPGGRGGGGRQKEQAKMIEVESGFAALSSVLSKRDSEDGDEEPFENDLLAKVETKGSTTTYTIPRKATVPSDKQPHKVTVATVQFEATLRYQIVPLVSSHAFRLADCVNKTQLELLAGPVHVFVNQSLVTVSQLKHTHANQEFSIYLGVDPSVIVSHTKRSMVRTVGMFSSSQEDKFEAFFQITNHTNSQISTTIMAQLPVANRSNYEVKLLDPTITSANTISKLDEYNNVIWKVNVKKDLSIEIPFSYVVLFPINTTYHLAE